MSSKETKPLLSPLYFYISAAFLLFCLSFHLYVVLLKLFPVITRFYQPVDLHGLSFLLFFMVFPFFGIFCAKSEKVVSIERISDYWKVTLAGCPVWMKRALRVIIVYTLAMAAFYIFILRGDDILGFMPAGPIIFSAIATAGFYSYSNIMVELPSERQSSFDFIHAGTKLSKKKEPLVLVGNDGEFLITLLFLIFAVLFTVTAFKESNMAPGVLIISCGTPVVIYLLLYFFLKNYLFVSRCTIDEKKLHAVDTLVPRTVYWDDITYYTHIGERRGSNGYYRPETITIYPSKGLPVRITGRHENFDKAVRYIMHAFKKLYGIDYDEIAKHNFWGDKKFRLGTFLITTVTKIFHLLLQFALPAFGIWMMVYIPQYIAFFLSGQ